MGIVFGHIIVPNVLMTEGVGVRIAGVDGVHHVLGKVPPARFFSLRTDQQFDGRRVTGVIPSPGIDDERQEISGCDRDVAQSAGLAFPGNRLGPAVVDRALPEDLAARPAVVRDRPGDAIASRGVGIRDPGLHPDVTLDRTAPGHRDGPVRARVHGHTAGRQGEGLDLDRVRSRVGPKPGSVVTAPTTNLGTAGDGRYFVAQQAPSASPSGDCREVAGRRSVARTKKPFSGARSGPVSRSAGRKEKLPDLVNTVRMVRSAFSRRACWGQSVVFCVVPSQSSRTEIPRREVFLGCDCQVRSLATTVPASPGNDLTSPRRPL